MSNPTTNLPIDDLGYAIQAVGPDDATVVPGLITNTSQTFALPVGDIYELTVTSACYVKVGSSEIATATSSHRCLLAGSYVYRKLPLQTHISILRVSADGIITITRLR